MMNDDAGRVSGGYSVTHTHTHLHAHCGRVYAGRGFVRFPCMVVYRHVRCYCVIACMLALSDDVQLLSYGKI